jgi:hypothetical protein
LKRIERRNGREMLTGGEGEKLAIGGRRIRRSWWRRGASYRRAKDKNKQVEESS